MAKVFAITRDTAVGVFSYLGWKTSNNWNDEKLVSKLPDVEQVLDPTLDPPEDDTVKEALAGVIETIKAGGSFEIVEEAAVVEAETPPEPTTEPETASEETDNTEPAEEQTPADEPTEPPVEEPVEPNAEPAADDQVELARKQAEKDARKAEIKRKREEKAAAKKAEKQAAEEAAKKKEAERKKAEKDKAKEREAVMAKRAAERAIARAHKKTRISVATAVLQPLGFETIFHPDFKVTDEMMAQANAEFGCSNEETQRGAFGIVIQCLGEWFKDERLKVAEAALKEVKA